MLNPCYLHVFVHAFASYVYPALISTSSVLTCSLLASLQLIEVPTTNRERALVLVHAASEVVDVCFAGSRLTVAGVLNGAIVILSHLLLLGHSSL